MRSRPLPNSATAPARAGGERPRQGRREGPPGKERESGDPHVRKPALSGEVVAAPLSQRPGRRALGGRDRDGPVRPTPSVSPRQRLPSCAEGTMPLDQRLPQDDIGWMLPERTLNLVQLGSVHCLGAKPPTAEDRCVAMQTCATRSLIPAASPAFVACRNRPLATVRPLPDPPPPGPPDRHGRRRTPNCHAAM